MSDTTSLERIWRSIERKVDVREQVADTLHLDPRPTRRDNLIYRGGLSA